MAQSSTNNDAFDPVWDPFKETIRSLYLDEDLTLEDVRSRMETVHQFSASKSQYESRFKKWDFRKYRTREDWKIVGDKISKRKRENKESEVYDRGKLVNSKKVRKETLRCGAISGTAEMPFDAPSPQTPQGMSIRTPPALSASPRLTHASIAQHVTLNGDDFSFEMGISDIYLDDTPGQFYQVDHQIFDELIPCPEGAIDDDMLTGQAGMIGAPSFFEDFELDGIYSINVEFQLIKNLPWFKLQILTEEHGRILQSPGLNGSFKPFQQSSNPFSSLSASRANINLVERHNLLSGILSSSPNGQAQACTSHFTTILQDLVPEKQRGDMSLKVQKFFDPSNRQPLYQLFEIVSYFSSNNNLSAAQTDCFLKWVIDQNHMNLLKSFLQIESLTTQAFSLKILESGIRIRNTKFLTFLITSGVKFDEVLEQAIEIEDPKFLKLLLESGVNPSSLHGASGACLLHKIAGTQFVDIARTLIDRGADVNLPVDQTRQTTILYEAVWTSNVEMVRCLLDSGAFVDRHSTLFRAVTTPLGRAVLSSKIDIIKALLEKGADASSCFIGGEHIFEYSALDDRDVYQVLSEKCNIIGRPIPVGIILDAAEEGPLAFSSFIHEHKTKLPKHQLETALSKSVARSSFTIMSLLLDNNVDPNGLDLDEDERPLMKIFETLTPMRYAKILIHKGASVNLPGLLKSAIDEGNLELLNLFIDHGMDLDTYGSEALGKAAENGRFDMVACLVRKGVDVNAIGEVFTPLQQAAASESIELVQYLIELGADINTPASAVKGRTALQRAVEVGDLEMVAFLLDQNADINAPPAIKAGRTVLEAALSAKGSQETRAQLFRLLLDYGASVTRPPVQGSRDIEILHELVKEGEKDLIRLVVKAGADVNRMSLGKSGTTPLQLAVQSGSIDMVKLLLEHGADVNSPPGYSGGRTALQAATSLLSPQMDLVQLLIDHGANINAKASVTAGITAIQGAAIQGHIKIAVFLIGKGADVNARPAIKDGRTAIEGAAEHGRLDMVQLLLNAGAIGDVIGTSGFKTAIELAEKNRYHAIAQLLRSQTTL